MSIIDINRIMNYLPHRYPFLLIDKVLKYEIGKELTAIKNVTYNEEFFCGHFPIKPIMPGVLIVESIAQAAGILFSFTNTNDINLSTGNFFYLAGIDNARFKKVVGPGDTIHIVVKLLKSRKNICMFSGEATVDGKLSCSVDLILARESKTHGNNY